MNSQPESRILIELCLACLCIIGDVRRQQLPVTLTFRRSRISIDDRLHDAARAENCCWTKRQNVLRRATLSFVGFRDDRPAGLKLVDVMLENRFARSESVRRHRCKSRLNRA